MDFGPRPDKSPVTVELDYERKRLRLSLLVDRPPADEHPTAAMRLSVEPIENMSRVEAFFFGRKLKPVGEHLDQVMDVKRTSSVVVEGYELASFSGPTSFRLCADFQEHGTPAFQKHSPPGPRPSDVMFLG